MNTMRRNNLARKAIVAVCALPFVVYAYILGPDPRNTGAPGDSPQACASAGCHTGTTLNGGPGRVEIEFPSGTTYVPGQKQRWTVRVTDAGQRVFGFQATARLESNPSAGQAGTFSSTDANTQILCDDGSNRPAAGCRANFTVEFIEHARAGNANTFTFEWTPPATNVGNVRVYVAGNAANGNGTNSGDRIYTANYTLTPSTGGGGGNRPVISQGGVADGFNFGVGVAPSTWTAIFGTNLATVTKTWDEAISGTTLPTTLEGVSVSVNGKAATVSFVSPGQVNVLVPTDIGTGTMNVTVTNANGESAPLAVTGAAVKPAFYAPFAQNNRLFVTAVATQLQNGQPVYVGKQGVDPRVTRGARPGEILQVFGTGFGATNPVVPTTQIVSGAPAITSQVRIRFGETVATFAGSGNLVAAGLYQFNVTVPATLADGDYPLIAEVGGVTSSSNVYITVQR
ncbi:MAG: hypothetical protein IT170_19075 [Bryobacterales bacterium]|nr:hypothetical protein [Bryobacterales bacterium]